LLFGVAGAALGAIPQPATTTDSTVRYSAQYVMLMVTDDPNGLYGAGIVNQLAVFAKNGEVPKRAAVKLGRSEDDGLNLAAQIDVSVDAASAAVRITTTQDTPDAAVNLVNTFGEELATFIAERQDDVRTDRLARLQTRLATLKTQLQDLQAQLAAAPNDAVLQAELNAAQSQYSVIAQQADTITNDTSTLTLTELDRGKAVEVKESTGLSAPKSRTSRGVFGLGLGLLVGGAVAIVLGRLDRRIRNREYAESVFGGTASTNIPLVSTKSEGLDVRSERHDQLSDSYRTLRSVVTFSQAALDDDGTAPHARVTLVVSACAGDGKTSVAANLAAAMSETGKRVVLVNGDFRRPTIAKRLLDHAPAVLPYALEDLSTTPLLQLLQRTSTANLALFDLSSVKASPGNLARATNRLMPDIIAISDAVVIDSSPIGLTAEVLDLLPLADTVVMVIRLGHTLAATAQRTMEMLQSLTSATIHLALMGDAGDQSPYYQYEGHPHVKKPAKDGK
jgi:Mrp family chromosome partitioning ATPase/capsular polysaccharide biosynthesis protein